MNKYLFFFMLWMLPFQNAKTQNKSDNFVIKVPRGFDLSSDKIYFWYSATQQKNLDKVYKTYGLRIRWLVNGLPMTESKECHEKSTVKDARLVYVWEKGKDSLVITKEDYRSIKKADFRKMKRFFKKKKAERKKIRRENRRRKNEPVEEIEKAPIETGLFFFFI